MRAVRPPAERSGTRSVGPPVRDAVPHPASRSEQGPGALLVTSRRRGSPSAPHPRARSHAVEDRGAKGDADPGEVTEKVAPTMGLLAGVRSYSASREGYHRDHSSERKERVSHDPRLHEPVNRGTDFSHDPCAVAAETEMAAQIVVHRWTRAWTTTPSPSRNWCRRGSWTWSRAC